ncbi:hypothetical protein [Serratia nevei]|uniref:hypothetical protein n=1 Tax=Serratia nevei TaxID=2703794 RepID=UPI003FA78460
MIKTAGMPWQFLRQIGDCRQYIDTQIYFSLMNKQVSGPAKLAIIGGSAVYLLLIVDGCDTQRLSPYASGSLWIQDANHLVVRYPENLARAQHFFAGVRAVSAGHREPARQFSGDILAG